MIFILLASVALSAQVTWQQTSAGGGVSVCMQVTYDDSDSDCGVLGTALGVQGYTSGSCSGITCSAFDDTAQETVDGYTAIGCTGTTVGGYTDSAETCSLTGAGDDEDACTSSSTCGTCGYCNMDEEGGSCESCSSIPSCESAGLPADGQNECEAVCVDSCAPDPSVCNMNCGESCGDADTSTCAELQEQVNTCAQDCAQCAIDDYNTQLGCTGDDAATAYSGPVCNMDCGESCGDAATSTCAELQEQVNTCAQDCAQCAIDDYNTQLGCTGADAATAYSSSSTLSICSLFLVALISQL